ncbi:MAG: hypothetical protein Q7T55_20785, partial [Solirubrobacteraceae bacterium]|nr:hypothetical protein [Solirubrobacteraceae bacterium]
VRRGVSVKFSLGTGSAVVRLQVRSGERWTNVARIALPRGKGKRTLEPGKEGRKRLAAATVEDNFVQARYAVALSDGSIDATAWKTFRLTR